jgi:uncharacterized protein YunC (DUF1805 family)
MITTKVIKINNRTIEALCMKLQEKNLIVLRGAKGYVMCGYLNMEAANKFNEVAVKITGVATIDEALKASAAEVSVAAAATGIKPGQPVQVVLELIA